ncbi:MAG: peptide/nickel transport system ATP-binding protein [Hyphomicrobiaceae bacterium]
MRLIKEHAMSETSSPLVTVNDLRVTFASRDASINAVNGVSFELDPGEVLCILGESGSGKSVTMRAMMRLLPKNTARISGQIDIAGNDVVAMDDRAISDMRGPVVSMIFQEPMTAFDPVFTIGDQIAETIVRHEGISHAHAMARALELLDLVQIPSAKSRLKNYPFEMSGGMRQRAMIALALSCRPSLLLADEPTTALDATVQIQILLLLRKLRDELGMAIMFVTHDIGVAVEIADKLAVMYAGRFVETGLVGSVFSNPAHHYTHGLMASTVKRANKGNRLLAIDGSPPDLAALPPGCAFAPRCRRADASCQADPPPETEINTGHKAACYHPLGVSESVLVGS